MHSISLRVTWKNVLKNTWHSLKNSHKLEMSSGVVFDQSYRGSQSLFVIGDKNKHFHDDCRAVCSVLMMIAHLPMYWLLASCPEPAVPANNLLLPYIHFSFLTFEENVFVFLGIFLWIESSILESSIRWRNFFFLMFCAIENKLLHHIHFSYLSFEESGLGFE